MRPSAVSGTFRGHANEQEWQVIGLDPPDFSPLAVFVTRQDKPAPDTASCDKRLEKQRRELDRGSISAFRNDFIHAAPVVLKVLLR